MFAESIMMRKIINFVKGKKQPKNPYKQITTQPDMFV